MSKAQNNGADIIDVIVKPDKDTPAFAKANNGNIIKFTTSVKCVNNLRRILYLCIFYNMAKPPMSSITTNARTNILSSLGILLEKKLNRASANTASVATGTGNE